VNTVAVVQARMTSTRLPGKVLLEVLGRPMLGFQLERVRQVPSIDAIIIATTTNATDDPVAEFARTGGYGLYRGSEHDVLARFQGAVMDTDARAVVRLTADCPLTDPDVIEKVIQRYMAADPACDYVTNAIPRSYPAGLDVEVFSREALEVAAKEAVDAYDREHVTPFLYRNPERFRLLSVVMEPNVSGERWTLDEPGDFELIRRVLNALYPDHPEFRMADVIEILDQNPDWRAFNGSVCEKPRMVEDVVFKGE
jgi:spore coat polysaccharide biosynthesis protein SpsF